MDSINAVLIIIAALLVSTNVYQLLKDKAVRGVKIIPTAFFAVYGYWDIVYYRSLEQFISMSAGVFMITVNTTWVALAIYYTRKNRGIKK